MKQKVEYGYFKHVFHYLASFSFGVFFIFHDSQQMHGALGSTEQLCLKYIWNFEHISMENLKVEERK